ncbi:hypothetical protein Y1Q_0013674 [Alligator mississippiensis]|uniref:Uncharacterized protein n=1 Tax=Alligator mississippiensis TaxID=8496 RepID=A0A151P3X9_ALLMI|nr:hypothetical protein Y1Q_0013674 [Alligator mississippiensis]
MVAGGSTGNINLCGRNSSPDMGTFYEHVPTLIDQVELKHSDKNRLEGDNRGTGTLKTSQTATLQGPKIIVHSEETHS